MLDVKQLRVLRAVAEHGSFSAAAESLSYTQPAISQQVAALEKQTGTTLVDRTSRGVRLTEAGLVFEYAEYNQPELERFYEGIELHRLVDDPMYLALPLGHPAANKPRVRLRELSDETWIQESGNHSWCGRFHETACLAAGFKPKVSFRSDDYNVVQG